MQTSVLTNVEPSVEVGTEEGVSVCLEPPGSTCPDSVQIVDATVNTSIHKQCLQASRCWTLPSDFFPLVSTVSCPGVVLGVIILVCLLSPNVSCIRFTFLPEFLALHASKLSIPPFFIFKYRFVPKTKKKTPDCDFGSRLFQSLHVDTVWKNVQKSIKMLPLLLLENPKSYTLFSN